jgi:hypothetical protein
MTRLTGWRSLGIALVLAAYLQGCATSVAPPAGGPHGTVPLDSTDPRYRAYLSKVRERIQEKWGYPCIKTGQSCEYKEATLDKETLNIRAHFVYSIQKGRQ